MSTIGHVKVFIKDTADLWKYEAKYIKTHWKGLVIVTGIAVGAEIGAGYYQHKKWQADMKRMKKCEEKARKKTTKEYDDQVMVDYVVE